MKFSRRSAFIGIPVLLIVLIVLAFTMLSASASSPPKQPIAFSHVQHAEDNQIACVYCHEGVKNGPVAGIPSVEKCMGCHRTVDADRPEIAKVAGYWEQKEPIPWARVNYLPDHVYFTHQRHVQFGIDCVTCHGQIQAASGSFSPLRPGMTWCLACHSKNNVSTDCVTCHK